MRCPWSAKACWDAHRSFCVWVGRRPIRKRSRAGQNVTGRAPFQPLPWSRVDNQLPGQQVDVGDIRVLKDGASGLTLWRGK